MIYDIMYDGVKLESITKKRLKDAKHYIRQKYKEGKFGLPTLKDMTPKGFGFNKDNIGRYR